MIYLDNAATTQLSPTVFDAMMPYLKEEYGNASSVHSYGRTARLAIERARGAVAQFLGALDTEIIFTSSATEANNLAIKGVVERVRAEFSGTELEIVASPVEHPCVMEALRHVEKLGWARIVWLPVDQDGMVSADSVGDAVSESTVLVCVMYVNNEIGSVMPLVEIGGVVREIRNRRMRDARNRGAEGKFLPLYFHTDAVQAIQYFPCLVSGLGVDFLSLTGHKFHGPKGTGVLYVRDGIEIVRQIDGGGQEYYKRGGTENVAGIVGMGAALSILREQPKNIEVLRSLQEFLVQFVSENISGAHLTGHATLRAPHITSFVFENVDPEALVISLDREGFAVSSGSACSSGVVKQSHVIEALHLDIPKKSAALRISTTDTTSRSEVEQFTQCLQKTVSSLREMDI
jgi:cysteine desulfurase